MILVLVGQVKSLKNAVEFYNIKKIIPNNMTITIVVIKMFFFDFTIS